MANLNARALSNRAAIREEDIPTPQIRTIVSASRHHQGGGGIASVGISGLIRSLGTPSFIRQSASHNDQLDISTIEEAREPEISDEMPPSLISGEDKTE